jgi:hypothetical protein
MQFLTASKPFNFALVKCFQFRVCDRLTGSNPKIRLCPDCPLLALNLIDPPLV